MVIGKQLKRLAPLLFILILLLAIFPKLTQAESITYTTDLGLVANPSRAGLIRDGGAGGKVGSNFLWTFGDTIFSPASVDGVNLRSNSAATADINNPLRLSEPLDTNSAPSQFIDLSPSEKSYNSSHPADDRYAIWPFAVVPKSESSSYVYYTHLKVNPGFLNYQSISTGVAEVQAGSTHATKLNENLFSGSEFSAAGFEHDGYIYLMDCKEPLNPSCKIARAPRADAAQSASFRFWNGTDWVADSSKAQTGLPGSSTGFGVIWSPKLSKFIMAYAPAFSKDVILRFADNPQGPWSEPQKIFTSSIGDVRAVYPQQDLSLDQGSVVRISYYSASPDSNITKDQLRLLEVKFATSQPEANNQSNQKADSAPSSSTGKAPSAGDSSNWYSWIVGVLTVLLIPIALYRFIRARRQKK